MSLNIHGSRTLVPLPMFLSLSLSPSLFLLDLQAGLLRISIVFYHEGYY